jgi:hypothetical protein
MLFNLNNQIKMNKTLINLIAIALLLTACNNERKRGNTLAANLRLDSKSVLARSVKPTVNVYIENSGSMFGYISTGNDFDRSISSLLTSIRVSEYADSINLFYINSKTFKQNVDIPTYIRSINLHNAQTWPGNLGRTDLCALFDTVTSNVKDNTISIFVSDCIFSPGRGVDASRYIGAEKDCITLTINQKLKSHNLAFVVYRLLSEFRGEYFDCQDNVTRINNQRPYFIWIIGKREHIAAFKQKIPKNRIEGQLQNSYTIFKSESNNSYAVQLSPKIGSFDRTNPTTIKKTKRDDDSGKFMFSVGVDFSSLLVDETYLTNPKNFKLSNPNYSIEIIKKQMGNHTHLIRVTTTANIISPTKLTIQLKNNIPDWVKEFSDETCTNINSNGMMQKTYGLKQIVNGIYAAYNYIDDILSEIIININQNP